MQEKTVILTPNKRLARNLQNQFCLDIAKQNKTTWPSIKILPLTAWLINCWQENHDLRILLSPNQEKLLWQKIITENLGEKFLNLTNLVINAHKIINEWQLKENEYATQENEDIVIFQTLYKKFKEYCLDKNLITINEIPTILQPFFTNYSYKKITFAGFVEYNPQLQAVIAAIKKSGCEILELELCNYQNSAQKKLSCDNLTQELVTCAKWAKKITKKHPTATIGVVIPNLVELRTKILHIFTEVFGDLKQINISLGKPLGSFSIIDHTLESLSLNENVSLKTICKLLLSPFIENAETERSERIILNQQLKQLDPALINLLKIKERSDLNTTEVPLLMKTLQKWGELFLQIQNKTLYCSEWAQIFAQILKVLGWPGENNLSDLELAAIQSFLKSLQELATGNIIIGKQSCKKALQTLHTIIANTTVQPDRKLDTPINIMGILEAASIKFDYLWIMGMDQENWPPAATPNPFLPIAMQKKLSLPHASAERELQFCDTLTKRFKCSAPEIIFSYVKQIEDHLTEPSPLLSDISNISIDDLGLEETDSLAQKIYQSKKLEIYDDKSAPALMVGEITHANSRLIEQQSLCPFRAFMEFRLKAKEPQQPSFGISKINRGIVIHHALEQLWQQIRTQQNLCCLTPNQLQDLIKSCLEVALNKLDLTPTLNKLEKKCLLSLLTRWLEIEKTRIPFQIIATEKTIQINTTLFPIKLRIDRIDQLTDGSVVLIDYKTGNNLPSIFDWFGPRLKNLQLPLYSLAINSIQSLAFAQINIESTKLKNISLKELAFGWQTINNHENSVKNNLSWHKVTTYWQNVVHEIINDFAAGKSFPSPVSPQTCRQCYFKPVCRHTIIPNKTSYIRK